MLETELVMKMYYELYEKKLSSLDTKHDIQFRIIHKIYRKFNSSKCCCKVQKNTIQIWEYFQYDLVGHFNKIKLKFHFPEFTSLPHLQNFFNSSIFLITALNFLNCWN